MMLIERKKFTAFDESFLSYNAKGVGVASNWRQLLPPQCKPQMGTLRRY